MVYPSVVLSVSGGWPRSLALGDRGDTEAKANTILLPVNAPAFTNSIPLLVEGWTPYLFTCG